MNRSARPQSWVGVGLLLVLTLWSAGPGSAGAQAPPGGTQAPAGGGLAPAGGAQAPAGSAGMPTEFIPGEILVQFRPGTRGQAIAETHRQNGGQPEETIPEIDVHVVRVPRGQEAARAAAYAGNPNVAFAERNGVYSAAYAGGPNDPRYTDGTQWQYHNTGQNGGTSDADIDALEAWNVPGGHGSSGVAIAILDTGIALNHAELPRPAKVTRDQNFATGLWGSPTPYDLSGHGTHVAGSAAALTNNGIGVAGTCPECVLYNVKVLNEQGLGSWSWIANGITWAARNGAKVVSMSIVGSPGSRTLESAVNYAWNRGAVVVAAAGNNGNTAPSYPAYYQNVIAVAATDRTDAKASFSNYGDWVDIAAPGVAITSTFLANQYFEGSGTSMATPHVAGVAGLVWSVGPSLIPPCVTNTCVRSRIEATADQKPPLAGFWPSGRRLNACKAVGGPC
jgi:thermitase